MDEYERIEEELSQVYSQYVVKIRCLAYLEEQLQELERTQKIEFSVSIYIYTFFPLKQFTRPLWIWARNTSNTFDKRQQNVCTIVSVVEKLFNNKKGILAGNNKTR